MSSSMKNIKFISCSWKNSLLVVLSAFSTNLKRHLLHILRLYNKFLNKKIIALILLAKKYRSKFKRSKKFWCFLKRHSTFKLRLLGKVFHHRYVHFTIRKNCLIGQNRLNEAFVNNSKMVRYDNVQSNLKLIYYKLLHSSTYIHQMYIHISSSKQPICINMYHSTLAVTKENSGPLVPQAI